MKKLYICILLISLSFLLSSCGVLLFALLPDETTLETEDSMSSVEETDSKDSTDVNNIDNAFIKEFGSYSILDGWEESDTHSTKKKFFYVKEGTGQEEKPNNVSVMVGENKYAEEDHMDFRDAIMFQFANQIGDGPNSFLTGSGSSTEQGYIVYVFTIDEEDWGVSTFFYIVGDYKYCEIYLTNFDGSEEADLAAQTIVDSFVWAEE